MTTKTKPKLTASDNIEGTAVPNTRSPRPPSKIAQVIVLLEREGGATLAEMIETTGWQPHSARAVLTGLRKKGHAIVKAKRDDQTCYRMTDKA